MFAKGGSGFVIPGFNAPPFPGQPGFGPAPGGKGFGSGGGRWSGLPFTREMSCRCSEACQKHT